MSKPKIPQTVGDLLDILNQTFIGSDNRVRVVTSIGNPAKYWDDPARTKEYPDQDATVIFWTSYTEEGILDGATGLREFRVWLETANQLHRESYQSPSEMQDWFDRLIGTLLRMKSNLNLIFDNQLSQLSMINQRSLADILESLGMTISIVRQELINVNTDAELDREELEAAGAPVSDVSAVTPKPIPDVNFPQVTSTNEFQMPQDGLQLLGLVGRVFVSNGSYRRVVDVKLPTDPNTTPFNATIFYQEANELTAFNDEGNNVRRRQNSYNGAFANWLQASLECYIPPNDPPVEESS